MFFGGYYWIIVKNNSKEGYFKYFCILLVKICYGSIYIYGWYIRLN